MPVPVFHAFRSSCQMGKGLQPELAVIGHPLGKPLRLCLQHIVIILFQGAGHISAKGDLLSRQL